MGGRGAKSSVGKGNLDGLKKQYDALGEKMASLAQRYGADWASGKSQKTHQQYYRMMRTSADLKSRINRLESKQIAEKRGKTEKKTFVNSYGEATKRYITTPTYERAQKKLSSRVQSLLGR